MAIEVALVCDRSSGEKLSSYAVILFLQRAQRCWELYRQLIRLTDLSMTGYGWYVKYYQPSYDTYTNE